MGCLGLTEIVIELGDLFLVTIGIREERVGIDDAFVEDDFVAFGFFHGREGLGIGLAFDLVWVVDPEFPRSLFGFGDLIDDVGLEKVKVQLRLSMDIEGEPVYLAFDFALMGSVPVILGASGREFHDMIVGFQFAGEFAQMITQGQHGLSGSMREDDGIGIEVEDLLGQELTESFLVEFETGPAGGETGHEDVDIDLNYFFLVHALIDHFDHLFIHDA